MTLGELASILTILVVVVSAALYLERRFGRVERDLKDVYLERRFGRIERDLNMLMLMHRQEILRFYGQSTGGPANPHPTEKDVLLQRLQEDSISYEEALRLQAILREEEKRARAEGDSKALLAIAAMLALVGAILSLQSEKG